MIDDKKQPSVNDHPEQTTPKYLVQQVEQDPATAPAQPGQRMTPGRKPLFRQSRGTPS